MQQKTVKEIFESSSGAFQGLKEVVEGTKSRKKIEAALQAANETFSSTLDEVASERKFLTIRKPLVALNNVVQGLLRGIADQSVNYTETKNSINQAEEKFFKVFEDQIDTVQKNLDYKASTAQQEQEDEGEESASATTPSVTDLQEQLAKIKPQLKSPKHEGSIVRDPSEEQLAKQTQRWHNQLAKDMPKSMNKQPFLLVTLPVVPIYADFTVGTSENLASLGISHTMFHGYAVFENQRLICISRKAVAKSNEYSSPLECAESLVEFINDRMSGTKYSLASESFKSSFKNSDILMFWMLPTKVLSLMLQKQHAGSAKKTKSGKLNEWDFPVDRRVLLNDED